MAQPNLLLNCELGAEEEIIGKLKELENVIADDITTKLEAETTERIEIQNIFYRESMG